MAVSRWMAGLCLGFFILLAGREARSANGDLILTSTSLEGIEIAGICADPDGTFWAVGESSDKIYHLNNNLQKTGEIPNPHEVGTFPNLVLSRGIAHRLPANTLLVLAKEGSKFLIREVGKTGAEVPSSAFEIDTSTLPAANFYGLTYDTVNNQIWTIEDNNDLVIRADLSGFPLNSFSFPDDNPPETILRGRGISFFKDGLTPYIYMAYGDIFTLAPNRILELTVNGLPTGFEIPLENVPPEEVGSPVKKIGAVCAGAMGEANVAVVAGARGILHVIERERPDPIPPSFFRARLSPDNQVILTWINHGSGVGGSYLGLNAISIMRNGSFLVNLEGSKSQYIDQIPPQEGKVTYTIQGSNGGAFSPPVKAAVVVGKGGLIRWIPFPGIHPYDATWNPATGNIYVTDVGNMNILRFDRNLVLQGALPSPLSLPGGIAFNPDGNKGAGSLMVATSDGVLMREIDLEGNKLDYPIPIAFRGISNPQIGGMFFNPSRNLFSCVETSTSQIISFDPSGIVRASCIPPDFLTGRLEQGVGLDPPTGNIYSTFEGGVVREILPEICIPTNFSFDLKSLGQSHAQPNFSRGITVINNTILVCARSVNALFQVLIFPQGQTFVRGDPNQDGEVDLSDAVMIAEYLFKSGAKPFCLDAADPNDDGELDVSDPIYILFFMFVGGDPPKLPYPEPGIDPTFLDQLEC